MTETFIINYQLGAVITLLKTTLHPESVYNTGTDESAGAKTKEIVDLIANTREDLQQYIAGKRIHLASQYMCLYQSDCIRAMDMLYHYTTGKHAHEFRKLNDYQKECYYAILLSLRSFLKFLFHYFKPWWNFGQCIPHFLKEKRTGEVAGMRSTVEACLKINAINDTLQEIYLRPFDMYLARGSRVSYAQLNYLLKYMGLVQNFTRNNISDDLVLGFLMRVSFNQEDFYEYFIANMEHCAGESGGFQEKLQYYRYKLKDIKQTYPLLTKEFDQTRPSLDARIRVWLAEEIAFMESHQQAGMCAEENASTEKLLLNFTLREIAIIIQLLIDADIILKTTFEDVAKKFAGGIITAHTENVTAENIRRKSYGNDKAIFKKLIDHLLNVLKLAQAELAKVA